MSPEQQSARERRAKNPHTQPGKGVAADPDVLLYNLGDQSEEQVYSELMRLLNRERPEALELNECRDKQETVRRVARDSGYALIEEWDTEGAGGLAILLREDCRRMAQGAKKLSGRTKVGKNVAGARRSGYAEPKALLWVRYRVPILETRGDRAGKRTGRWRKKVRGVCHLVPSAGRKGNWQAKALHGLQTARCAAWLRTRRNDAVLSGDMNADARAGGGIERALLAPLRAVAVLYAVPSKGSRAIDVHCIPRQAWPRMSRRRKAVRKRRGAFVVALPGYRSDHKPVALYLP